MPPRKPIALRGGTDWKRLSQIIDEAYDQYISGMKSLRRHVVAGVRRKVRERTFSRSRSRVARRRSRPRPLLVEAGSPQLG